MVLLTQEQFDTYAPLIGSVVLHYAQFESYLHDLERTVRYALEEIDQDLPYKSGGEKLDQRLETIVAGLKKLGAAELAAEVSGWSEQFTTNNQERNTVIHGEWWWFFAEDTVSTRKPALVKKGKAPAPGEEFEYVNWTPQMLDNLIGRIDDARHLVYEMEERVEGRFLRDPDEERAIAAALDADAFIAEQQKGK
jgi:hypothetical protein